MIAGAEALLVTQWPVDERTTYLLMCKFYELLLAGNDPATALQRAQWYLRTLRVEDVSRLLTSFLADHPHLPSPLQADLRHWKRQLQTLPAASQPFADPYFWAPFILIYPARSSPNSTSSAW
jgi:CHAT domain-containing protein